MAKANQQQLLSILLLIPCVNMAISPIGIVNGRLFAYNRREFHFRVFATTDNVEPSRAERWIGRRTSKLQSAVVGGLGASKLGDSVILP